MKCPKCGSNLNIDDVKCSFCEADNPFATKHREDMQRLKEDYKKTKSHVMEKTTRFNRWIVKILLIAFLLVMNILLLFFCSKSYDVERYIKLKRAQENYEIHVAKLKEYESTGNYIAFSRYFSTHSLASCDLYDEFLFVYSACENYTYAYKNLMRLKTESFDEDVYPNVEDCIESLVKYMEYMYTWSNPDIFYTEEAFKEEHVKCMRDAISQMEELIKVYCNLTTEEMDMFRNISSAKRQVLVEEGLSRDEENP